MICPNCHAQIGEGCSFCPSCGFPLRQAKESAAQPPSSPAPENQSGERGQGVAHPEGAPFAQQANPPFEGGAPQGSPVSPLAPAPEPKVHRKLTAIEIWVIVIGICALIALIISIVNAAHIETIKNALIEVIQNIQGMSN